VDRKAEVRFPTRIEIFLFTTTFGLLHLRFNAKSTVNGRLMSSRTWRLAAGRCRPTKLRQRPTRIHGITSQKTVILSRCRNYNLKFHNYELGLHATQANLWNEWKLLSAVTNKIQKILNCKRSKLQDYKDQCKIWGFRAGDYEECRLLGCGAV
jgi:hypothetical protein